MQTSSTAADQGSAAVSVHDRHFFGRRKGRKLSTSQLAGLRDCLTAAKLDLSTPCADASQLRALFLATVGEVWLEIGFGGGEHLLQQLQAHGAIGMLGAEPFINGVASVLKGARHAGLEGRLRCHDNDVMDLLAWLPPASIARAFMLFPDPWPKKRHRDRRLFSLALLDQLLPALTPGAEFRFASDIADYADQALEIAAKCSTLRVIEVFTSQQRSSAADWPQTRYEMKAERGGRSSTFIVMRKCEPNDGPRYE